MSILFYFFSLLGRSSLSLFSYTAAGGTDSGLTPPSGSRESAQDKKEKEEQEKGGGGSSCPRRSVFGGSLMNTKFKTWFCFCRMPPFKSVQYYKEDGPIPGEIDKFSLLPLSPLLITMILFYFPLQTTELYLLETEPHSGYPSEAMYHLLGC